MKNYIYTLASICISLLLCYLLFKTTDWREVLQTITNVDIAWVIISQCCVWLSCFVRVQRWHYIVLPLKKVPFHLLFNATQIGFLINFTTPARIGEVVRAFVLSRSSKIHLSQSLVMVAIDRISDLLLLIIIMLITLLSYHFNSEIVIPEGLLNNDRPVVISAAVVKSATNSMIVICFVALFFFLLTYRRHGWMIASISWCLSPISEKWSEKMKGLLHKITHSMGIFASGPDILKTLFFSSLTWGLIIGGSAALLKAFHIQFSWVTPVTIIIMIVILISMPITPGLIGQYHLAVVSALILTIPQLSYDTMRTYAIAAHILNLLPIAVLGSYALFNERLHFFELTRQSSEIKQQKKNLIQTNED